MNKIEIKSSKKKIFLMALGCVVLGLICYILFRDSEKYVSHVFRNSTFIKITGIVGITFSIIGSVFLFKKIFDNKIGLLIDSEGITDNSNAISIGLIMWEDIKDVRIINVMSTKFLVIELINPEKYLINTKNNIKLKLMNYNLKMYGTPVTITSNTLDCSFEELENHIIGSFEEYKRNNLNN